MKYTVVYSATVGWGHWGGHTPKIKRIECEPTEVEQAFGKVCNGELCFVFEGWPAVMREDEADTEYFYAPDWEEI